MLVSDAPRWFAAALDDAPEVGGTTVDGVPISYRAWGRSGDARHDLVLVHGGAAHSGWWDFIAPLLARGRRVVALDLSGHGDSGHRVEYSLDGWADELAAVIAASGLRDRPVLAGHSMGGLVSTVLAGRGTPELGGLIVIDSPLEPAGPATRPEPGSPSFGNARVYSSAEEAVARFRPVPAQATLPYTAARIAATSVREVAGGWGWKFDPGFAAMAGPAPTTLDGLACPALFVAGERGILSAEGRRALEQSAEVSVIEIPDAGHAMMLDQPVAFVSALRGILAGWETAVDSPSPLGE